MVEFMLSSQDLPNSLSRNFDCSPAIDGSSITDIAERAAMAVISQKGGIASLHGDLNTSHAGRQFHADLGAFQLKKLS
jgi:hypothetical protein